MNGMAHFIDVLLRVFTFGLFFRMVLSWIQPSAARLRPVALYLDRVYEPILRPLRRVIKPIKIGAHPPTTLDVSPVVLLLGLWWIVHPFLMWTFGQPGR